MPDLIHKIELTSLELRALAEVLDLIRQGMGGATC